MSDFEFDEVPNLGHNQGPEFEEEIDFAEDANIQITGEQLAAVSRLANEYTGLKEEITELESQLERKKGRYDQIRFTELPDAMAAARMDEFKSNGVKVGVTGFVRASLPKDPEERKKAAEWLRAHHKGAIIKRQVGVQLGIGNDELAEQAAKLLQETMPGVTVTDVLDVHHSTLSATLREMLENGEDVPTTGVDIGMNLFVGREAKISKAKR